MTRKELRAKRAEIDKAITKATLKRDDKEVARLWNIADTLTQIENDNIRNGVWK